MDILYIIYLMKVKTMKLINNLFLFCVCISFIYAGQNKPVKLNSFAQTAEYNLESKRESSEFFREISSTPSTIHYPNNTNVNAVLVDSSKNGYGMIVSSTNPLVFKPEYGFVMAYRQWQGENASSGYIGSAYSPDGIDFATYSNLNINSPGETTGRYPSIVGGNEYPYVIWNEFTGTITDPASRPLYSWDEFSYGGGSFFSPPVDINNGCNPLPCDPYANWTGSPALSHDGDTPVLNVAYSQWTGVRHTWLYHSDFHAAGYFTFNGAYLLFDEDDFQVSDGGGSFTSSPVVDVNEDGTGYAAVTSYFNNDTPDAAHTFMIRKTIDHGATWSGEGGTGMNMTDYYYIPLEVLNAHFYDGGLMPEYFVDTTATPYDTTWFESAFIAYDIELKVDPTGGLHLFAAVVPQAGDFVFPSVDESVGFYHFYTMDPSDPESWQISFVTSTATTFSFSHGDNSNWQRIFPSAAISVGNSNIMYLAYTELSDTTPANINYDVMIRRSEDGGTTWGDPMNVTNTIALEIDEIDAHLAPLATDEKCFVVYMMPDYSTETVDPPVVPEDYKNRIFFAEVMFGETDIEDNISMPEKFHLDQNFPNPFNPQTVILYELPVSAHVQLTVYDILGKEIEQIVNTKQESGSYEIVWDASQRAAGIYFYRLIVRQNGILSYMETKKLIVLK